MGQIDLLKFVCLRLDHEEYKIQNKYKKTFIERTTSENVHMDVQWTQFSYL